MYSSTKEVMKKLLLLSVLLYSLSPRAIYSSDRYENSSEVEYSLASIQSGSYQKHHHATQTMNEEKFSAQSEIAKNKNNKFLLAQRRSTPASLQNQNKKPVIGSAAWVLMKNNK